MKRFFSVKELSITVLSLLFIFFCLSASQWQWNKGAKQTHINKIIRSNLASQDPLNSLTYPSKESAVNFQWRSISLTGGFSPDDQLLIRNRYFQGVYGFEVLQLFHTSQGDIWVNRGWVKAGAAANTPPNIPVISSTATTILGRIRIEDFSRQVQGSFFAQPSTGDATIQEIKRIGKSEFNFYLDLLSSSDPKSQPLTTIDLPDLTNGPHYAYAIQWLAFATLILIGRIILFRESQRLSLV